MDFKFFKEQYHTQEYLVDCGNQYTATVILYTWYKVVSFKYELFLLNTSFFTKETVTFYSVKKQQDFTL